MGKKLTTSPHTFFVYSFILLGGHKQIQFLSHFLQTFLGDKQKAKKKKYNDYGNTLHNNPSSKNF